MGKKSREVRRKNRETKEAPEGRVRERKSLNWKRLWNPYVWLVIGLVTVAYWPSFQGAFIMDDTYKILGDDAIQKLWPPWYPFYKTMRIYRTPTLHLVRPVIDYTFAINYAISGYKVWSYHAFNLLLHLLATLTLYGIVRRTLLLESFQGRYEKAAAPLAVVCALAWGLHPLQTQAVTYVVQRFESGMGLFFLLTLYGAIRGWSSPRPHRWFALSAGTCLLGVGSKETIVAAPLLVALYEWYFVHRNGWEMVQKSWRLYAGLAGCLVVLAVLVKGFYNMRVAGIGDDSPTAWEFFLIQMQAIPHYLRLSIWPHPLVLDYQWPRVNLAQALPYGLLVGGLMGATGWALLRRSVWGYLGAWFFLTLAPSSMVPLKETVVEHRMYLPLAGVIVLMVMGLYEGCRLLQVRWGDSGRVWTQRSGWTAVAAILMAFLSLTYSRNLVYQSAISIWQDTANKQPLNPRARNNYGYALLKEEKYDKAIIELNEALKLKGDYDTAFFNLGVILRKQGHIDQAISNFERAVEINPKFSDAHQHLAAAHFKKENYKSAIMHFRKALELTPTDSNANENWKILQKELEKKNLKISDFNN